MIGRIRHFGLPLLTKELVEQANRRRLFVTRVLFALLLFSIAAFFIVPIVVGQQFTPFGLLGTGRTIFKILMFLQFGGVYIYLPVLTCGALTAEKERNTLGLLFLTKLTPWTIIFEKLGSRIVPMFSLLLTSLPLMAYTYALGGVETFDLVCAIWFLTLTMLQVGSFAMLATAHCRTTPAAYIATVAMSLLSGAGFIVLDEIFFGGRLFVRSPSDFPLAFLFFPAGLMETFALRGGLSSGFTYLGVFLASLPTLFMVAASLWLARVYLVRRAFLNPTSSLLNFFKWLDRFLTWANQLTAGVVLVKESTTLPDRRPIEWREIAKRSLGQFRYLVRIFVALELPVAAILIMFAAIGPSEQVGTGPTSLILGVIWFISTMIISGAAANMIALERGRQTLDVLLTSPLSSREIILEKMSGLRRLMLVCAVPLLTCAIFQTWWRQELSFQHQTYQLYARSYGMRSELYLWYEYLAANIVTIAIYLPLIAWVSLSVSMRAKTITRAMLASLGTIVAWCVVPVLICSSLISAAELRAANMAEIPYSPLILIGLSSPLILLVNMETSGLYWLNPVPFLALILNSMIYGAFLWLIRRRVLAYADHDLGRLSVAPTQKSVLVHDNNLTLELPPVASRVVS